MQAVDSGISSSKGKYFLETVLHRSYLTLVIFIDHIFIEWACSPNIRIIFERETFLSHLLNYISLRVNYADKIASINQTIGPDQTKQAIFCPFLKMQGQ